MATIYTVRTECLIDDADKIERSARDNLNAWILTGQSYRYGEEMAQAGTLRRAAKEKNLAIRREILRNGGFIVKSPKQAGK